MGAWKTWWMEFRAFRAIRAVRPTGITGDDWKEHDRQQLAAFLASNTGQKVRAAMQEIEIAQNRAVVMTQDSTEYQRGVAGGWRGCFAYFVALGTPPADGDDHNPEFGVAGEPADFEKQFSP